jgi:hypothetical protein
MDGRAREYFLEPHHERSTLQNLWQAPSTWDALSDDNASERQAR